VDIVRLKNRHPIGTNRGQRAFTLVEVVISAGIAALCIGGIVSGYITAANRAEWTLCSSAAQMMAQRHLEQTKTARWPTLTNDILYDELALWDGAVTNEPLDIPVTGAGLVIGTSTVTISTNDPPARLIRVDCVWSLVSRGPFTNTAFALRFPEP